MKDFKYNKVLLGFIIIGMIAAFTVVWQRYNVEIANNQVDLVMDYDDIVELSQLEGVPQDELISQFKNAGVSSLAVYETTLDKLNKSGKISVLSGGQIINQYSIGLLTDTYWRNLVESGRINAEDIYVIGRDIVTFNEVEQDLIQRLSKDRVTVLDSGRHILQAKANFEKVMKWNLGLSTEEMKYIADQGLYVIARPTNYTKVAADEVDSVFERMAGINNVTTIIFSGDEALGYPDLLPNTLAQVKAHDLTLGLIEHPLQLQFFKQDGLLDLVSSNDYKAARIYVIPKDEQPKLKVAEAIQRWVVTDQERNIRINLLRKYDKPEPGKSLIETNIGYVSGIKDGLLDKGFTIGRAGTFQSYFPNKVLLSIIIVGAISAGILFLTLVWPAMARFQYVLLAVLAAVCLFPIIKGGGTTIRQLIALMCAVVFPVLAMTWQIDRWREAAPNTQGSVFRIIIDGIGNLFITVMLSMIGALFVASVLADVRFLLEMQIFRGVKVTFVAPLILITIVYFTRYTLFDEENYSARDIGKQLVKLLDYPVYIKTLIAFAAAAVVAWVFVGRSGHTAGVPVPAIELKMRALLERLMYARPREKEFMIGHPAFFLAVMAVYRQWPRVLHYVLVVVATIGQGSLVETFAHLRTPVFMSFMRGLDGMALGFVFGVLAVIGVQVLRYLSFLCRKETY